MKHGTIFKNKNRLNENVCEIFMNELKIKNELLQKWFKRNSNIQIKMCLHIMISFRCCHIFYQDHNKLTSIVCLKKLFILCFEIVAKNIMFKFTFFICNQQLSFTFIIPSSLYTNNDNKNGNKASTLKRTFEFSYGIHVENIGINSGSKAMSDNKMVIYSIVMITCMSPFSNPFWILIQCQNFQSSQTCLFVNTTHAYLFKVISSSK